MNNEMDSHEALKKNLKAIDDKLRMATIVADIESLSDSVSDDFIYVHAGAVIFDTKETWIDQVSKTKGLYLSRDYKEITVKLCGDIALISGFLVEKYDTEKYESAPEFGYYHQLRIYRDYFGSWKLIQKNTTWALETKEQTYEVLSDFYKKIWSKMNFGKAHNKK